MNNDYLVSNCQTPRFIDSHVPYFNAHENADIRKQTIELFLCLSRDYSSMSPSNRSPARNDIARCKRKLCISLYPLKQKKFVSLPVSWPNLPSKIILLSISTRTIRSILLSTTHGRRPAHQSSLIRNLVRTLVCMYPCETRCGTVLSEL